MFGYIKTQKSELRIREYEYYRAAYCGLCRSMGKCTGACSRLSLSYDFAFLSHFLMSLAGVKPTFRRRRCLVHPFHPRMMMEENEVLSHCAYASAILVYEKCRDDVADEKGFKKLRARLRKLFFRRAYRKACRKMPALAQTVREKMLALAALEKEKRASVDEPAAIFGDIVAAVAAYGLEGTDARIATIVGEKVGRFIYIADAIDDLEKDEKSGNFNPILLLFGKNPDESERKMMEDALLSTLADVGAAFDLMEQETVSERRAVLENILYLGMPQTVRVLLYGEEACRKEEQSEQQPL